MTTGDATNPPRSTSIYSLWLMPPPVVRDRFAVLIDRLSQRLGTPCFEPHITLCGAGRGVAEEEVRTRVSAAAAALTPVPVQLTDIGHSDHYFRCLYVRAGATPELLAAHAAASTYLCVPAARDFAPHLSLVYASLSHGENEKLIGELGRRIDASFTVDRVALWCTAGMPAGWRCIARFPITGPQAQTVT